jgi:hypothetical protein
MRLSGPRSRPTANQKFWQRWNPYPGPLSLQPGALTTKAINDDDDDDDYDDSIQFNSIFYYLCAE